MKKITFDCKNKDSEIVGIVICILMFIAGWLISAAIARSVGDSFGVTVLIPIAFLICGVVFMNRRKRFDSGQGTAQFSKSGRVKLTYGGRSMIFELNDIKNVYYTKDTLTNDGYGNTYVLVIKLPFRVCRIFAEAESDSGFEQTELYAVYEEIKQRIDKSNGKAQ